MYKILGADRKEYGPAPAEVIRRWIAERRLDGRSQIRAEGETIWRALSEIPEFQSVLAGVGRSAAPAAAAASGTDFPAPRTSGLAVASLVMAIISPCTAGLAGVLGLILGGLALRQIRKSQGRRKGRGLAIGGMVVSAVFLIVMPVIIFLTIVAHHQRSQFSNFNPSGECIGHLQQISEAVRRYANDNNDRLPPAATWCDAVQSGVNGLNTLQCPSRQDLRSGYGMNSAVAGRPKYEVPPDTVLFFESDGGWNASGGMASMITIPRHGGLITVVLADGTIRQIGPGSAGSLRWAP